jgi:hypothetical protein
MTANTERWDLGLGNNGTDDFRLYDLSNNLTRLYVKRDSAGGFIGIGTTTPTAKLHINPENASYVPLKVTGFVSQSADLQQWQNAANTTLSVMTANGSFGLGTSTPWKTLSVTGTVAFDGLTNNGTANYVCVSAGKEITYSTTACSGLSSEKYKHDIASIASSSLSDVMKLRPVSFIYNPEVSPNDQSTHLGFIAEEVNKINPNLVVFDADGSIRSVKYDEFSPVLVKAMQEQQGIIESIASSTAKTVDPAGEKTFLGRMFDRIGLWLADSANAIGDFFAGKVHTKTLCVGDTIEGETCITKAELDQILMRTGTTAAASASMQRVPSPEPEPILSSSTLPIIEIATSTDEVATTTNEVPSETATSTPILQNEVQAPDPVSVEQEATPEPKEETPVSVTLEEVETPAAVSEPTPVVPKFEAPITPAE